MYRTLSRNGGKRNGGLSRPRLLAPLGLKSVPDLLMPVSLNARTYLYEADPTRTCLAAATSKSLQHASWAKAAAQAVFWTSRMGL